MNYQETLDYLYNSLPTYHRIGASALKPSLDNTLALCKILGDPQHSFPSIHIAGTNGKGSTSHMLAAILQECGYKTALFTSPHLKNFTERIKVNGKEMPSEDVMRFVENNKVHFERIKPSFFEMTAAMAFDHFAKEKVDIAVIEVGLGGRLDSTNIISPLLSVITNISYDHQNILGDTLNKIAYEKAGIIKKGIPVVISEYQEEVIRVFEEKAKENSTSITIGSGQYQLKDERIENGKLSAEVICERKKLFTIVSDLSGKYQLKNIPGVLTVVDELRKQGYTLTEEKVASALSRVVRLTGLKGRWQILSHHPLTICDTAHNEAGIQYVMEQLASMKFDRLHFVYGTVNDKDIQKILPLFSPDAHYYFCRPNIPRGLDASLLYAYAQNQGLKGEVLSSVSEAIAVAKANANPNDLIFIGGSNFVVAEIENL